MFEETIEKIIETTEEIIIEVDPKIAKKLAVGMEAIAKIAKLRIKYGGWFKPTKTSYSPPRRRLRLEREAQGE